MFGITFQRNNFHRTETLFIEILTKTLKVDGIKLV